MYAQMFFDLRCLPERVEDAVQRVVEQVHAAATTCFDMNALAKSTPTPAASTTAAGARKPGSAKGALLWPSTCRFDSMYIPFLSHELGAA